ncbi:juvenile hormone esterase isoform X2 [Drosophila obscura]|uniref:juvenile hormone esterase isoform X1 n=1 Tax=Drosophila obscura TaxID=7282 RepID=UPI001BB15811|nr:juvenile hormone esterase isoform X1 [Drosophila obscura]XP_041448005.1 juvenile hormone esterase isoform X2 [Drosophila obscura]
MRLLWSGVLLTLAVCPLAAAGDPLDVCLKDLGCLRGTHMPGYQGEEFEAFMGIPFAQPPVDSLRLRNPVPAAPWEGILDAGTAKDGCLQKNYFSTNWVVSGVEDCLYLNVYRPKKRDGSPLPVMFYIHGGGYFSGTAHPVASGPEYMMDTEQVIMVTVPYRLGPLGFLSTGDTNMPGNFALKDQRLAMQWVQQHIAEFGGDPQLVTIFGHSAGGMSAHYHMLSPSSKGLFQRSMSLVGTILSPFLKINKEPLAQARKLAAVAGIEGAESLDSKDLAQALRELDPVELHTTVDSLKVWYNFPFISNTVVVEPVGCPEAFFTEDPVQSHLEGRINQVPWLLSVTSRAGEGALSILRVFDDRKLRAELNSQFLEHFSHVLNLPDGTSSEVVREILDAYGFEGESISNDTLVPLAEIAGDFGFFYPLYETASTYAKYANLEENPLSFYFFEYRGLRTLSTLFSGASVEYGVGAAHMDDALHTIRIPAIVEDYPKNSEDADVVKRMTSLMVDFAKTGIFHSGTSCQASDFTDQQMCSYVHFGGTVGNYKEDIQKDVDLAGYPIWKRLFF